jgi:2-octaprenyl-3-methyl-6-methoxy-1,4-benzoquinol hydroxylase
MTTKLFDIVIVGGGMVGASLALRFSQAGLQVAVIEKTPAAPLSEQQPIDLRVSAINRRSEQWLSDIGVWQQLPAQRLCPYRALQAFEGESLDHNDGLVFTASELKQPYLGHIVENNSLQATMWQQFDEFITLFSPATVTVLSQGEDYSTVSTKEFGDIRGRLFIAADGAQSQLRTLAGIGNNGWQYQQACLVATVDTEYPQQDITWQQFTEQAQGHFCLCRALRRLWSGMTM